jgi:acetylornithine deacetylase
MQNQAIELLKKLISIPSLSKEEDGTAACIEGFLNNHGIVTGRDGNNIFAINKYFDHDKPSILLNSHHDTVKPNPQYTRDPHSPDIVDGKLYGLGSNDAGGPLVSLIATFLHFYGIQDLKYNVVLAATAEEEISGKGGIESLLKVDHTLFPYKGRGLDFAIVGEPTLMQMAIAEKGLLVIDAQCTGKAGHAAREEGDNAILKAASDILTTASLSFEKVSPFLGPVKVSSTVIHTENKAHNAVPATCDYVLDCRVNELYTHEELLQILKSKLQATLTPRSTRLRSSMIPLEHPIVQAGIAMGKSYYGSPTTSDKALMPFPALKMGPGDSARSHSADEYIFVQEIHDGIQDYINLIYKVII